MSQPSDAERRLAALLRLLSTHGLPAPVTLSEEPTEALVAHQLNEVSQERFRGAIAFLDNGGSPPHADPVAALATQLLLNDYALAVRQLRAAAMTIGQTIERAGSALDNARGLIDSGGKA